MLMQNNLCSAEVKKHPSQVLEECPNFHVTALPNPARKVSLSSLSRDFNMDVCVGHMFVDEICVFHITETKSRYSVGSVV